MAPFSAVTFFSIASSSANCFPVQTDSQPGRSGKSLNRFFISELLPRLYAWLGIHGGFESQSLLHQRTASQYECRDCGAKWDESSQSLLHQRTASQVYKDSYPSAIIVRLNRFFISELLPRSE